MEENLNFERMSVMRTYKYMHMETSVRKQETEKIVIAQDCRKTLTVGENTAVDFFNSVILKERKWKHQCTALNKTTVSARSSKSNSANQQELMNKTLSSPSGLFHC